MQGRVSAPSQTKAAFANRVRHSLGDGGSYGEPMEEKQMARIKKAVRKALGFIYVGTEVGRRYC